MLEKKQPLLYIMQEALVFVLTAQLVKAMLIIKTKGKDCLLLSHTIGEFILLGDEDFSSS